jgi:hypothetical protein
MKEWKELPWFVHDALSDLGGFSPTVRAQEKLLKGYMNEEKTYLDPDDLRRMATALTVAANWLDERAEKENE